jgi:hypothetical protein
MEAFGPPTGPEPTAFFKLQLDRHNTDLAGIGKELLGIFDYPGMVAGSRIRLRGLW